MNTNSKNSAPAKRGSHANLQSPGRKLEILKRLDLLQMFG
jgi:hypothetical protein